VIYPKGAYAGEFVFASNQEDTFVQTFIDINSPRHQLPFEELPRGFVKFPEHMAQRIADLAAQYGYSDDYARKTLVQNTLIWFYEGLPVAYRELPDGLQVLALGWEEAAQYELNPPEGVKVMQP
jgi:hypothetical protein